MSNRLEVTPANVRAGAGRMAAESTAVTGLHVPDPSAAMAGLPGFATAGVLADAQDAVQASLNTVGDRYQKMSDLCLDAVQTIELADLLVNGLISPPEWMSQQIGDGLAALGDLNPATP